MQNSNIDIWILFMTGLPGLFALIYNIVKAFLDWKKRPAEEGKTVAETEKTKAETAEIQGEVFRGIIDELQEQIETLRHDFENERELRIKLEKSLKTEKSSRIALERTILQLKEQQDGYENYINALHLQMEENDIVPIERPKQLK